MYLVSVLTLVFAAVVFFAGWLLTDWPPWLQAAVGLPIILLASLAALPVARGAWVALEYYTDLRTGETERADYVERAFERR